MDKLQDSSKIFGLRYIGSRFLEGRLPVDVLSDLPAFRDLLVASAKAKWRAVNSNRQRVPKGFDKSLSLDLFAIENGSAIPKLIWDKAVAQQQLPGFTDQLEEIIDSSFKDIINIVDSVDQRHFQSSMSFEHVRALNKFGAGLREGEKIEFEDTEGADGKVVYLDMVRRKKLITRIQGTYQSRFEGTGILVGTFIDQNELKSSITIRTGQYGDLSLSIANDRIKNEFDGNLGSDIQFDLQIELDNNDNCRNILEVYDIVLIDAQLSSKLIECQNRINELSNLEDNWLDGNGIKIHEIALVNAKAFLLKRPSLCKIYSIYPTENGAILFEFKYEGWDYSVEFGKDNRVEMYGIEIDGRDQIDSIIFNGLNEDFINKFDTEIKY